MKPGSRPVRSGYGPFHPSKQRAVRRLAHRFAMALERGVGGTSRSDGFAVAPPAERGRRAQPASFGTRGTGSNPSGTCTYVDAFDTSTLPPAPQPATKIHTVARWMGHANINMTYSTYMHLFADMHDMDRLDGLATTQPSEVRARIGG